MHGRLLGRIWGTMLSDVGCVRITQWCGWLLVFLGIVHIPAGPAGAQDIVWRVRAHDSPMWGHPYSFLETEPCWCQELLEALLELVQTTA
jgi:hypothetical protein